MESRQAFVKAFADRYTKRVRAVDELMEKIEDTAAKAFLLHDKAEYHRILAEEQECLFADKVACTSYSHMQHLKGEAVLNRRISERLDAHYRVASKLAEVYGEEVIQLRKANLADTTETRDGLVEKKPGEIC